VIVIVGYIQSLKAFINCDINRVTGFSDVFRGECNLIFHFTIRSENLYPPVTGISNINLTATIHGNANWGIKCALSGSFATKRKLKVSLLIKDFNAIINTVYYIYTIVFSHCNISGLQKGMGDIKEMTKGYNRVGITCLWNEEKDKIEYQNIYFFHRAGNEPLSQQEFLIRDLVFPVA